MVKKESNRVQYYTTKYERNSRNRKAAIHIYRKKCMACVLTLEKLMEKLGEEYIEVHHNNLKPIWIAFAQIAIE